MGKAEGKAHGAIRRLTTRVHINHLLLVSQADFLGRTTPEALSGHDPSAAWLKEKVSQLLGDGLKPQAVLLGRHLIAQGLKPGREFREILNQAFEAQLDGAFSEESGALQWLKHFLKSSSGRSSP